MKLVARILDRFAKWALSKNAPGGYESEDDTRWAYTIETAGDPYLTRVLLPRVRLPALGIDFRVVLHHFHRPDAERDCHSHPWSRAASFVLSGSYVEERVDQIVDSLAWVPRDDGSDCDDLKAVKLVLTDTKVVRWFNYLTGEDYHRVTELRGDVWTLFVMGSRQQDWGFLVDGVHVPHADYFLNKATGDTLDKIGAEHGVQRTAELVMDMRTEYEARLQRYGSMMTHADAEDYERVKPLVRPPTFRLVEPDDAYRERIRVEMKENIQ